MGPDEAKKHCETKIIITLDELRCLWSEANDRQRLEMIKSIIWTAPDIEGFYVQVMKVLNSNKFKESFD